MRYFILCLIVMLCVSSCSKTKKGEINGTEYRITPVDSTMNYVIVTAEFTGVIFGNDLEKMPKDESLSNLTPEEIFKVEKIFRRCLYEDRMGADSMAIDPRMIRQPSDYYRQYKGFIDEKGEKNIGI